MGAICYSNKTKNHKNNLQSKPKKRRHSTKNKPTNTRQPTTKKEITRRVDIRTIFKYSARKKNTKPADEYSTL